MCNPLPKNGKVKSWRNFSPRFFSCCVDIWNASVSLSLISVTEEGGNARAPSQRTGTSMRTNDSLRLRNNHLDEFVQIKS